MTNNTATRPSARFPDRANGAYGLRLSGVGTAAALLAPARADWPAYELVGNAGAKAPAPGQVTAEGAVFSTPTGVHVEIDRQRGRAVFTAPSQPDPEQLVHPLAAHLGSLASWWAGRESLHAGAVVIGDGVWALVGARGAGKSSTLALLAREGTPVVCDDLLVLDGLIPFAGPRSLDLRPDAAEALADGRRVAETGGRERWRVRLEPLGDLPPLRGIVHLTWGDSVEARPLGASSRLRVISANRGVNLPPADPAAWLELAGLPVWELSRPRGWDFLPAAAERLRALAEAGGARL